MSKVDIRGIALCLTPAETISSGVAMLARCTGATPTSVYRWMRVPTAKRGALADALLVALDELPGEQIEAIGAKLDKLDADDVLGPPRVVLSEIQRLAKKG